MNTVMIRFPEQWSINWLKDIADHVEVSECLEILYEATASYLFWRLKTHSKDNFYRYVLPDIVQGFGFIEVPYESFVPHWDWLYDETKTVLNELNSLYAIHDITLHYGRLECGTLLVSYQSK